jgi:hypothetical protein
MITNEYTMTGDGNIRMTEPPDPKDVLRVRWTPTATDISNIQWYSHETGEGWISDATIDTDFFGKNMDYDVLDEFRNSYGSLFQYIRQRWV